MSSAVKITKIEAGKPQLETAIRMFFKEEDPVAIHTLAAAAHDVLWGIAKKRGTMSLLKNNPLIAKQHQKEMHGIVSEAKNFFKHGIRDPNAGVEFNPETTAYFLIDAIEIYRQVIGQPSPVMISMMAWFQLKNAHIFSKNPLNRAQLALLDKLGLNPDHRQAFSQLERELEEIASQVNSGAHV